MTTEVETLVVGAGPAGSAAATGLARAGVETLVVDRSRFPRDKCCGDGLTTLALRELERLGFDPRGIRSWTHVDRAVTRSPSGREIVFPLPSGSGTYAAVARRAELDAALVELCRSAGARVVEGGGLTGVRAGGSGVRAEVDGLGPIEARWLVAADGMWSPTRKLLGLADPDYRGEWHALRQYFEGVDGRAARELMVWFEPDLLPGYAWSFPLGGDRCNVGFGIRRDGPHRIAEMSRTWSDLLDRSHVRDFLGSEARPEAAHRSWPIPARVGRSALTAPSTYFVGDAAAVTDPMTGEGIGQALLTGRLAAGAIAEADRTEPTLSYQSRVLSELSADDRMARMLIPILRRPLPTRGALRIAGGTAWTRRNFARWMFEDYPRAIIATPRRWHRGVFTGPGAFRIESRSGASVAR
jgi:geranylgeranyl reductase family protein